MIGDQEGHQQEMINAVGKEIDGALAASIARLAQRLLMTGWNA